MNVSERGRTSSWRREWDSNPRYGFPYTRFPSVRLKPLGHPSGRGGPQYSRGGRGGNPIDKDPPLLIDGPHLPGLAHVVAAEFRRTLAKDRRAQEGKQRLRAWPEIVALAQREVEMLPGERHEAEARRLCDRARGDAAVGAVGTHRLGDVGTGRADRLDRGELVEPQAGAGDDGEEQQLRAGALRP